ncbi:Enoyl-CoA hydratase/isomerase [Popillia japonica]|uniref:Enoyl-CoA hydratase/isomerase n=1 Tax=Popillia japonica TaxID=7064 RepID=A0AAW1I8E2_POPJA
MSSVIVQKDGHVTTIGINRPEKRNCVDIATARLISNAIEEFENDNDSYVAVLYGVGGNFCAGYDLSELSKAENESAGMVHEEGTMGPTLRFIKKPMIAAVSGYAVAGGLELALMCDMRVVEETAIMGVFCRRFGVPLIDGGTVRLQAAIGLSRALDMILTGRGVTAKEAFEWGLANRVVACGTAYGQAIQLANSLIKFPQECMNADRQSAYNAAFATKYLELLRYEQDNGIPIISKESISGAKRFMTGIGKHGSTKDLTEKTIPKWEEEENKLANPRHKL